MPEKMSISVNGQSQVPPGFRFHPTEEELLQYYLRKKVSNQKIDLDVIRDVDLNKLEPWDIQEMCRIGSTPQSEWYFFSHNDKKYPTGTRRNRATSAGFWKATGRDKVIYSSNSKRIGMRKTLVFYQGRAPHGHKSDWITHEYRLHDIIHCTNTTMKFDATGEATQEEGWVVCRIFKKKLNHKTLDTSMSLSAAINDVEMTTTHTPSSSSDKSTIEQIFQDLGRTTCKINQHHDRSSAIKLNLQTLESPNSMTSQQLKSQMLTNDDASNSKANSIYNETSEIGLSELTTFDQLLVASQLINGQSETSIKQLACFNDPSMALICYSACHDLQLQTSSNRPFNGIGSHHDNDVEFNLWSFTPSSSSFADPLCLMSNTSV